MLLLLAAASSLQQQPLPGLTASLCQGREQLPGNNVHHLQCSVLGFFLHMYVWERGSIEVLFGEGSAWTICCVLENKLLKHVVKQSRNVSLLYHSWIHKGLLFYCEYFYHGMWDAAAPVCRSVARMPCCHKPRSPPQCPSNCLLSLWVKPELTQLYSFRLNVALWVTGWSSDLWNRKCSFKLLQL